MPVSPEARPPLLRTEGWLARWRSGLREFAIIVAGVLAALAAQALWEGRQEQKRERDYLRQLLADTRENLRRIDAAIQVDSSAGAVTRRVSDALYGPGTMPRPESLITWFATGTFSSSNLEALAGTYGALQTTGDLRLIRTDSLRAAIVAYSAKLASETDMMRFFLEQSSGDADRIGRALPFMTRLFSQELDTLIREAVASGFRFESLREDPNLRGIVFTALVSSTNRTTHLRSLASSTRELLQMLSAESPNDTSTPGRP